MLHQRAQILDEIADVQHQRRTSLIPGLKRCDTLQAQLQAAFDTALHQRNSLAGKITELADKVAAQRASPQGASEDFLVKAQLFEGNLRSRLQGFDAQLDGAEADLGLVKSKTEKFIQTLQQASADEVQLLEELSALQGALTRFVAAVREAGYEVTLPPMPVQTPQGGAADATAPVAAAAPTGDDSASAGGADAADAPAARRKVTFQALSPEDDAVPAAFEGVVAGGDAAAAPGPLPAATQEQTDQVGDPAELQLKLQRLLERMADMQKDLAGEQEALKRAVEANAAVREYKQKLEKAG